MNQNNVIWLIHCILLNCVHKYNLTYIGNKKKLIAAKNLKQFLKMEKKQGTVTINDKIKK